MDKYILAYIFDFFLFALFHIALILKMERRIFETKKVIKKKVREGLSHAASMKLNCDAQPFQSFFLYTDIRLIDWISLGAKSSDMHNKVGR